MIKTDKANKKKLFAAAGAAVLLCGAVLVIGGINAYLTDTDSVTNTFTVGEVTIDTLEPNYPGNGSDETEDLVPFEEVKKDPQIKNTGKNKIVVFEQVDIPMANIIIADELGNRLERTNTEVFDFRTTDGKYDSHHEEKWILLRSEWLNEEDQPVDAGTAVKVRRIYGYNTPVKENETTIPVFDVVRLCNVVEGELDNSVQSIKITTYAIQADNIAGITNEDWNETMNSMVLNKIFDTYMNQSASKEADDADNSNNQTLRGTTLNVTMTVANRHLRLNSGKEEDTRTTTMYNVAYTGPNTKPVPVFTSSDTGVATVDQNGNIEAVGVGKTTITMSAVNPDTGKSVTCSVNVQVRDMNAGE